MILLLTEYQNSKWDESSMGNPDEVSQDIYEEYSTSNRKEEKLQSLFKIYGSCQYSFSGWFRIFI